MRVAVFSTKLYDRTFLEQANAHYQHELHFFTAHLNHETVALASGYPAVCAFVNDSLQAEVLERLAAQGVHLIALRCAGFNNVDVAAAKHYGMTVVRVPAYSPHAVAEHALALLLMLNRKLHRAYMRVREGNFSLDGLLGFDLFQKTIGIIGTGKIGTVSARIFHGLGCRLLACDPQPSDACKSLGVKYVSLDELLAESDVISLHCPLTPQTHHMINPDAFARMKPGALLVNTSRGAIIDTKAMVQAIKSGHLGGVAIDVYEEEGELFFEDLSGCVIQDDVFARLLTFPNVVITGHQGFFTQEALTHIAHTTLANIRDYEQKGVSVNAL